MPDAGDQANEYNEIFHARYLEYRKHEGPKATGKCLCCSAPLKAERRWCDAWCRDEYLKEWRLLLPRDVPPAEREEVVVFGVDTGEGA